MSFRLVRLLAERSDEADYEAEHAASWAGDEDAGEEPHHADDARRDQRVEGDGRSRLLQGCAPSAAQRVARGVIRSATSCSVPQPIHHARG